MTQDLCVIEFFLEAVEDRPASIAAGRLVYKNEEWYRLRLPGGSDVRVEKVTDKIKQTFVREYSAFQEIGQEPENGFDLKLWPLMKLSDLKTLAGFGIKTVEALAELTDEGILSFIDISLPKKAKAWLEASAAEGSLRDENKRLKQELDVLKKQCIRKGEKHVIYRKNDTRVTGYRSMR